jgi:hypothetical protein
MYLFYIYINPARGGGLNRQDMSLNDRRMR